MTNPRNIRMTDIDWRTLLHDMGRSVRPLWRLSQHDPNRTPEDYGNGAWSALRLGEVADKGVRDILRHQDVGPKALDALHEIINMAIAGTLPLKGAPAPDSLWPADREENGRFSGDDYHEGIEEGWKAGAAQERRIWRMAVEQCFDGAAVRDVENYAQVIRAIRRAGRETTMPDRHMTDMPCPRCDGMTVAASGSAYWCIASGCGWSALLRQDEGGDQ